MKKTFRQICLPAAVFILILFVSSQSVFAAERCETIYGGGQNCVRTGELQIDKEILDPDSNSYVDNLGVESHRFGTAEEVTFKLKVKNVGDDTLRNVKVTDNLPGYLFFVGGSSDSYSIDELSPDETVEILVYAQVKAESQLPSDKSLICILNTAEAKADDEHDVDTVQLCLGSKVLGVSTLPKTGMGSVIPLTVFFLLTGLIGLILIRLNRKS